MFKNNGCDFEFGVIGENGKAMIACNEKTENIKAGMALGRDEYIRVYPDGINFELGTVPRACLGYFMNQIHFAITQLRRKYGSGNLIFDSIIPRSMYGDIDEKALISGCNPKLNCITGTTSVLSMDYKESILKHGSHLGSHLHHEIDCTDEEARFLVDIYVKSTLCIITSMLKKEWLNGWFTRTDIARIGNYRIKPYGLEWCDLGSDILKHPLLLATAVYLNRHINSIFSRRKTSKNCYSPRCFDAEFENCLNEIKELSSFVSAEDVAKMFIDHDYVAIRGVAKKASSIFKSFAKKRITQRVGFYENHSHEYIFENGVFFDRFFDNKNKKYLISRPENESDLWDLEFTHERFGANSLLAFSESVNEGIHYDDHLKKKRCSCGEKMKRDEYESWRSMCCDN